MKFSRIGLICAFVTLGLSAAKGAVITFDTNPAGGTPLDDAPLNTAYNVVGGGTVLFFFDTNLNNAPDPGDAKPVFEAYGPDAQNGFANDFLSAADTANGGLAGQLGSFFLRQLQPGTPPPPFIADYNTPLVISALSGEIWDIDGDPGHTERWHVDVLDASNNVLASQDSPLGDNPSLDGLPWVFSFSGLPTGVDKIRITFTGSKMTGLGLAFNNFDPTAAPEPSTVVLAVLGSAAFFAAKKRGR